MKSLHHHHLNGLNAKDCKEDKCKTRKHSNVCSHMFTLLSSKLERITNAEQESKVNTVIQMRSCYEALLVYIGTRHVAEK